MKNSPNASGTPTLPDSPEEAVIFLRRAMFHVVADHYAWGLLYDRTKQIVEDENFCVSELIYLAATRWGREDEVP